jgi:subtilase family serine protease
MPTAFLRTVSRLSSLAALCAIFSATVFAATADRIATMNSGQTVPLRGNVNHKALPRYDQGPVDPAMKMGTITLLTTPTAAQMKALQQLVAQQQDRKSANYHKWITPEQWADRFGLSVADMAKITAWLKAQGFTMISPAHGRNWVSFTGTAAQVQSAFGTEIHRYNVNGEMHVANATAPKIPAGFSGIVAGFRGLDDFRPKPRNIRQQAALRPLYTDSSVGDLAAPGDLAVMYDINALYSAGIDGTGEKVAVAGQTDIYLADLADFRTAFSLSPISCTADTTGVITICNTSNFEYVLDGTDPGVSLADVAESDLDLEWTGAVARNAQVIFVNSTEVFQSYYYAIDNNLAPVLSVSYGLCELGDEGFVTQDEGELLKGNSMGITIVNSSGDTGVAECDPNGSTISTMGLSVSYPASSQYVTGVGGTAAPLADLNNATYWSATNASDDTSLLQYIPEQAWNDDDEIAQYCIANPSNTFCSSGTGTGVAITSVATAQNAIGISSAGGGVSNCATTNGSGVCTGGFPQPSWQASIVIPSQAAGRFSPDVSMLASPNFPGYIFCTEQDGWTGNGSTASTCANGISGTTGAIQAYTSIIGGTSVSAPVFAGVVTLMNQYLAGANSPGLGNINPTLYALAATPSNLAFNHVTTGDSTVYCTPNTPSNQPVALQCPAAGSFGFQASNADVTTGFNLVNGLGSVDVDNLALAWAASRATTVTDLSAPATAFVGTSVTLTATVTPINATGTITFSNGTTVLGSAALSGGSATLSTAALPAGPDSVTATYSGSATLQNSTSAATLVTVSQPFSLAATAASFQVTQGQAASATVTVTQNGGFTGALTFTCTDTASESICTPPAATNATSVSFNITTTAPTSSMNSNGSRRIFYALLLPGLLGILFTAGSRRRSARGMRLLGLIVVLGFSTMWLGSCGGSSSSTTSNPGTPTGSYTITVNATTGGTNAATGSTTFTLVVVQ